MNEESRPVIRVLLVDDDEDDALLTRGLLSEVAHVTFQLEWVESFENGLARLREGEHDVALHRVTAARQGLASRFPVAHLRTPSAGDGVLYWSAAVVASRMRTRAGYRSLVEKGWCVVDERVGVCC